MKTKSAEWERERARDRRQRRMDRKGFPRSDGVLDQPAHKQVCIFIT